MFWCRLFVRSSLSLDNCPIEFKVNGSFDSCMHADHSIRVCTHTHTHDLIALNITRRIGLIHYQCWDVLLLLLLLWMLFFGLLLLLTADYLPLSVHTKKTRQVLFNCASSGDCDTFLKCSKTTQHARPKEFRSRSTCTDSKAVQNFLISIKLLRPHSVIPRKPNSYSRQQVTSMCIYKWNLATLKAERIRTAVRRTRAYWKRAKIYDFVLAIVVIADLICSVHRSMRPYCVPRHGGRWVNDYVRFFMSLRYRYS